MSHFNERVAAVNWRIGHLATLENAMGQLYRALEGGRAEMSAVAENVAARVAHGVFAQYGAGGVGAASPELRALEDGLAAVRATSAQADQRSQETLAAVHETLEQIIAKLSELEARGPAPGDGIARPGAARGDAVSKRPRQPMSSPRPRRRAPSPGQEAVRAHLAAQRQTEPASALSDFRLPPVENWSLPPPAPPATLPSRASAAAAEGANRPAVWEAQAAAMRHDFIAAARRAAMAAQPSVGGRRNRQDCRQACVALPPRKRTRRW